MEDEFKNNSQEIMFISPTNLNEGPNEFLWIILTSWGEKSNGRAHSKEYECRLRKSGRIVFHAENMYSVSSHSDLFEICTGLFIFFPHGKLDDISVVFSYD